MNDGQRCTTTGVMDNVFDDSLDVAVTFGVIYGPEFGGSLAALGVRCEDGASTLTLGSERGLRNMFIMKLLRDSCFIPK